VLECLATTSDGAAPLKVVPINGGSTLQLTEGHMNTRPLGWTADGSEVVFGTQLDGTLVVMSAPVTGGAMEELYRGPVREIAKDPVVLGGRHMLFGRKDGPEGAVVLSLLDLQTGSEREVSRTLWSDYTFYNTSRTLDGRFLYAERKEGRFEFMALDPEGDPELLRAFPDTVFPPILGVHGDRIAYWAETGDSSRLYLARAGEEEARTVLTFPGRIGQRALNAPSWSPDGRFLVSGYDGPGTAWEDALVVEIDASGEVVGNPWVIEGLPSNWFRLRWMPDSQGFLILDNGHDVWLTSIRGDEPPVNVTQEGVGEIWFYQLSPDGRYVAVSPEVTLGTSLWRVDLEGALAGYR
jgi:Tol biopolymer transport system component